MKRRIFLGGALAAVASPAARTRAKNGLTVLSGDSFVQDDIEYRLSDIMAPAVIGLASGPDLYAYEAQRILTELLTTTRITINETGPPDRWGRLVINANVIGAESITLQERLIGAGGARVAPETQNTPFLERLLKSEQSARRDRRGLWALRAYRVRDALRADDAIGAFHLVEGVVRRAIAVRGRFYLNFGDDYRADFTASATTRLNRRWGKNNFVLSALEGAPIRVRGYVHSINGPSIDLTHPQQIERLEVDA